MNRYELVNPHDPYVFDAADDDIAEVMVAALGTSYGWQRKSTGSPDDVARQHAPGEPLDIVSGGFAGLLPDDKQAALVPLIETVFRDRKADLAEALSTLRLDRPDGAETSSLTDLVIVATGMAARLSTPDETAEAQA